MPLTHSDIKQAVQQIKTNEFETLLNRDPKRKAARQRELEGIRLSRDRLAAEGISRQRHIATLSNTTNYEEVFKPQFWSAVADKIKIGDEIIVRNDNLTIWALLLVVVSDPVRNYCEAREIFRKDLPQAVVNQEEIEGFACDYHGITDKWIVTRKVDGHVMRKGLDSRYAALEYIRGDLRTVKVT